MPNDKPQLHVTSIGTLLRCGMQFYYRYVERLIIPPGIVLIKGTATHRAAEKNYSHKIDTGELLPVDAVKDIARDSLNYNWQKGVLLSADERKIGEDKVRGAAVDSAVNMAEAHAKNLAPAVEPKYVERPYVLELDGFPYDLAGTIDLQAVNERDAEGNPITDRIIDLKTSGKTPPANKAHESMQLTACSLAASVLDRKPIERVELHVVVDTGRKVYTCDPLVSRRCKADHEYFLRVVQRASEIIDQAKKTGAFTPADPDSWMCGPKFCGYWDRCPFARRHVTFTNIAQEGEAA